MNCFLDSDFAVGIAVVDLKLLVFVERPVEMLERPEQALELSSRSRT